MFFLNKLMVTVGSRPWHNLDLFLLENPIRDPWEPLWAPRNNRQNLTKTTRYALS